MINKIIAILLAETALSIMSCIQCCLCASGTDGDDVNTFLSSPSSVVLWAPLKSAPEGWGNLWRSLGCLQEGGEEVQFCKWTSACATLYSAL